MDELEDIVILKKVKSKFPVCNVIDARTYNGREISGKCNDAPKTIEVNINKRKFEVNLCTGSFNVYVLNIKEM